MFECKRIFENTDYIGIKLVIANDKKCIDYYYNYVKRVFGDIPIVEPLNPYVANLYFLIKIPI